MKNYKRASIQIQRNNYIYTLYFFILLVLSNLVIASLSVTNAIGRVQENINKIVPPIVTLEPDFNTDWTFNTRDQITQRTNLIKELADHDFVKAFEFSITMHLPSLYLRHVISDELREQRESLGSFGIAPGEGYEHVIVQGFFNPNIIYIENGRQEIIAGRSFSYNDMQPNNDSLNSVAIISKTFAHENNVWLGDILNFSVIRELKNPIELTERFEFYFEVIGIRNYDQNLSFYNDEILLFHKNTVFVPNWILEVIDNYYYHYSHTTVGQFHIPWEPHFLIQDHNYISEFIEIIETHFPQGLIVNDYSNRYSSIIHATNSISGIFTGFIIGGVLAIVILIFLINVFMIKQRKKEIGIYIILGEKKFNIVKQLLYEKLIIFIPSVVSSIITGNALARIISNNMILRELKIYNSELPFYREFRTNIENLFGFEELTQEQLMQTFDATLSLETIGLFFVIAFVIFIITIFVPIFIIMQKNTLKLLL